MIIFIISAILMVGALHIEERPIDLTEQGE